MSVLCLSFIVLVLTVLLPDRLRSGTLGSASCATVEVKAPLMFALLGLLAAFRAADVGNDTKGYLNLFDSIRDCDVKYLDFYSDRFEMGYIYLNKILSYVSKNSQIILIVTSAFSYYWYYKFIRKYSPIIGLSILVFFFSRFHDSSMNIVRQAVATGFVLWAYMELKKGKDLCFFLLVFLAFTMHKSSIVFSLAWFFTRIQFKSSYVKYFFLIWGIAFLARFALVEFIFSTGLVQSYFIDSEFFEDDKIAPTIILLMDTLILFFYLFAYRGKNKDAIQQGIASDLAWMLMACVILQTLGLVFSLMSRVSWYFRLFQLIAIPYVLYNMKVYSRYFMAAIIVMSYMIYYAVVLYYRPDWNHVYPYTLCFD